MKPLADYEPGDLVFTRERLDDEFRETFYVRDPARPCRYGYNVPIGRIGFVQGAIDAPARVIRFLKLPCRDPGEADGRTPCMHVEESRWFHLLDPQK